MGSLSANIDIGLIFSRPPLGHESRGKRGAARAVYRVESDLGISFLKVADGQPGIINDIDGNLTFRFSRLERFLPLDLPGWPGLSRSTGFCRHEEKQADNQSEKKQAIYGQSNHSRFSRVRQISFTIKAEPEAKDGQQATGRREA